MKNFLFLIAILIVLTTVIVGSNPQMHKTMNISCARLVVQDDGNVKNTDLNFENKDSIIDKNAVTVKPVEPVKPVVNVDKNNKSKQLSRIQEQEKQARIQAEQKRQAQIKKRQEEYAKMLARQKAQENAKKKVEPKTPKKADTQTKSFASEQARKLSQQKTQKEAKKKAEAKALAKKKAEEQAKKLAEQKVQEEAKKKTEKQKKLIEYQENILWNQWRANVCNKVSSKLDKQFAYVAPVGTVYTYSFDVDNKRRITNVVVKISRGYVNATTQQGIFMIQNAIKSLNLSSSLTFPSGSQRTTVKVSSGIERTSSQSTNINANSFNDVEKITKQKYE